MANWVHLSKKVVKGLSKLPTHVAVKLLAWVEAVEHEGIEQVRRVPGYHDEPLKGRREGQRSIRLSRAYRAIYRIDAQSGEATVEHVRVLDVNKHNY